MAQEIMNVERMGVNPKWPKYKSVIKPIQDMDEKWAKYPKTFIETDIDSIRKYITREDAAPTQQIPNKRNVTHDTPKMLGDCQVFRTLAQATEIPQWLEKVAKWMRYYQVGVGQSFFWHHRFNIIFPDHPHGGLFMFGVEPAASMMAAMALLGWREATVYQGYLTHAALRRNYQLVLQYTEEHRRAQAFMLRLFADWVGDVSHQWPAYAYDEPIYEALLRHWKTPNPDDLVPCLLAACDRHTYSAGKDTLKKFYDFNDNNHLQRTPIEILFVFRLREWEGLSNPSLDHPLMSQPFDQLPPTQPIPELDELMKGVLKRAREDWPQYDEVLSLASLRQP
jgi:hypothetical protein